MLNINSIFKFLHDELTKGSSRIVKIDDEHLIDSKTGVEYHLYDDEFKITHNDDLIAKGAYFTKGEQSTMWAIKDLITDPVEVARKKEAYPMTVKTARERLSSLYENPQPIQPVVDDDDAEIYTG